MPDLDIVAVGDLNPDLVLTGVATPAFSQVEQLVDDARLTIGSSAGIFACGAARLGLRTAFSGFVGADPFGDFMRAALAARGVDTSRVAVTDQVTTALSVILSRSDDRAILTYLGTIGALRREHLDNDLLAQTRHLHLGSYFLLDGLRPAVPALFQAMRARGGTVSLDTNYDPAARWDGGLWETLAHVDVFLPNATEARAITSEADPQVALARLAQVVPTVAVKLGRQGAIARQGDEIATAPAYAGTVVDTTGAGDSFDAGFIYGWLNGWPLDRTLRLACACGSLSTRAIGGVPGQATLAEALALMEESRSA